MPITDLIDNDTSQMNRYDFRGLNEAFYLISEYVKYPSNRASLTEGVISLKNELNRFFNDSKCVECMFTENYDKPFFGMCVMPVLKSDDTYEYIQGDKKYRINEYYVEVDSKLFDEMLDLTGEEFVAIVLHEIGHMVNDANPIEVFKKNMMNYVTQNGVIRSTSNVNYREILLFGIKDCIRKMDSIFEKKDDETLADEFVIAHGYGAALESALTKIVNHTGSLNKGVTNNFLVMGWTLRLYQDIKNRRIPALYLLRKMKELTPSHLEREELYKLEVRLRRIDDDAIIGNYIQESGTILSNLKRKGIRGYEDDYYELALQTKAVQKEDDALIILHKINSRIRVIEDYIEDEEMNAKEEKRWDDLLNKYIKLRDTLSNKTLQADDYSRIIVNYPQIRDCTTM